MDKETIEALKGPLRLLVELCERDPAKLPFEDKRPMPHRDRILGLAMNGLRELQKDAPDKETILRISAEIGALCKDK